MHCVGKAFVDRPDSATYLYSGDKLDWLCLSRHTPGLCKDT